MPIYGKKEKPQKTYTQKNKKTLKIYFFRTKKALWLNLCGEKVENSFSQNILKSNVALPRGGVGVVRGAGGTGSLVPLK